MKNHTPTTVHFPKLPDLPDFPPLPKLPLPWPWNN